MKIPCWEIYNWEFRRWRHPFVCKLPEIHHVPSESELIDLIYFNVISLIAVDAMCARLSFFVRVHDIVLMNLYANITKGYKSFPFMEEVTVANAIFFLSV